MGKSNYLLKEEYSPAASFLYVSFKRDRLELFVRFKDFTPDYLVGFEAQIDKVKALEKGIVLTTDEKNATKDLYAMAERVNKEFNFLVFYFKKLTFDTGLLSKTKKDLTRRNIEGAIENIKGVKEFLIANKDALVAKGMAADFVETLEGMKVYLDDKNVLQNKMKNQIAALYEANKEVYDTLYEYISEIADAGKRFYIGEKKAKEYTISSLISRMRSGKKGGGDGDATPPSA